MHFDKTHRGRRKKGHGRDNRPKRSVNRGRWSRIKRSLMAKTPPPEEEPFLFQDMSPLVVERPDHCLSRKDIDREALKVLYRLKDHGYLAYLVGGSVRDLLLGKRPKDFDIGTNARPEEVKRLFHYSRIIGKRFRLVHVYFKGGKIVEVSTFRRQCDMADIEIVRNGKPIHEIYGTPREDAFRRDLTINGLFYNIADFSIIDYVGGMEDLRAGIVRTIGEPQRRFLRDPVRMMRAIRHAARAGFQIENETWKAIKKHADKIRLCAIPRVRDEWLKDLKAGASAPWARYMFESGLMEAVFPTISGTLQEVGREKLISLVTSVLAEVDAIVKDGSQEVSDIFFLSAFALSLLHYRQEWQALESDRLRWPTSEVRFLIDDIFYPYDFKRADRDMLSRLLSYQWPIAYCKTRGNWQKRVWNKQLFPEALLLYNCLARALGEPEARVVQAKPRKKGRRRRKKRGNRGPAERTEGKRDET